VGAQEAPVGPIGWTVLDAAGMAGEIGMSVGTSAFDADAGLGFLQDL